MFTGPIFMLFIFGGFITTNHLEDVFTTNRYHDQNSKETKHDLQNGNNLGDKNSGKTSEDVVEIESSTTSDVIAYPTLKETNTVEQQCPEGFTFYRHYLGMPFCYFFTKPQPYPPACPYQNFLEYDSIRQIFENYYNQSIWVTARRNLMNGFGQFEWLYPSNRYMEVIKDYENPADNILERNCLIQAADYTGRPGKLIPVFCDGEYPVLCVYSYSERVIGKYCSKRNEFTHCISANLNLDNKCYCQANAEGMQVARSAFCQKLAEPIDRFQNHMLLNELTNKSPCWFGIESDGNEQFRWSSGNQSLDYTYWKENVNSSKRYGALDYAKPKGWILEDDYALKCAICETEVPYKNVTLRLVHISNKNEIELRIHNFFDVHTYFILQYIVACFTDANVDGLTTKILSVLSDIISIQRENYTAIIKVINYYPSYYWCETFQRPDYTRVLSNKILVYTDTGKHGNEYALTVAAPVAAGVDPYLQDLHLKVTKSINDTLSKRTDITNVVRPMRVLELSQTEQHMTILLHMSMARNDWSSEEEYNAIFNILQDLPNQPFSLVSGIVNLSRSEVCLPNITISGDITLHWPETTIGTMTLPKELCLLEDSSPVRRKCEGSFFFGGIWGEVQGECASNANISDRTNELYGLLNSNQSPTEISKSLLDITKNDEDVLLIDVHFMAEILEKLSNFDDGNATHIAATLSNIMVFNDTVLKESQIQLNSTDRILHALDRISAKVDVEEDHDYVIVKSRKVLVQVSDLKASNVTGLAIQKIEYGNNYEIFKPKPLYNNASIEELLQEDIEVAVFLLQEHIDEIQECMKDETEIKLALAFFSNDVLFNECNKNDYHENSRIISVLVPGFTCTFKHPIFMIFRPLMNESRLLNCGHWNYGHNEKMENINGSWEMDSCPEINTNESTYALCQFSHTTHFALLMFNDNYVNDISEENVLALNIITAVGCALSLLGLLGIFIMAIAFKSWRSRARNIIMLNFAVSLAAQMILLFISDSVPDNGIYCIASGASLHYTVLAEFAWMLIIAILQYRKFVLVFQKPIPYLICKCLIVGWCFPVILVVIQLTVFPKSYEQNSWGLCYPDGRYFYFGVALPIGIIVLINLFVFIKILVNVCNRKVQVYGPKDNDMKLQILLAILLFFLLGMSWIFGLAAAFVDWIVFSYLFCLTATLQGFVIFVFFVVMNEKSRLLWLNIRKICFCTDIKKSIYK